MGEQRHERRRTPTEERRVARAREELARELDPGETINRTLKRFAGKPDEPAPEHEGHEEEPERASWDGGARETAAKPGPDLNDIIRRRNKR